MAAGALVDRLLDGLPPEAVLTDPDVTASYANDMASFCPAGAPAVVVLPRTVEQVQHVMRTATALRVPVVPQGARTGLSGAANATDGCIVLSLTRMDAILEINPVDRVAVVEPGVVNATLSRAVGEHGLYYPPDPSSWETCTIGGNIGTASGGLCCVKYGVTAEYVLGLDVVLADGRLMSTGRRTAKGVAGYDLTRLFVGSEGSLGIVVRATLALRPKPPEQLVLAAEFASGAAGHGRRRRTPCAAHGRRRHVAPSASAQPSRRTSPHSTTMTRTRGRLRPADAAPEPPGWRAAAPTIRPRRRPHRRISWGADPRVPHAPAPRAGRRPRTCGARPVRRRTATHFCTGRRRPSPRAQPRPAAVPGRPSGRPSTGHHDRPGRPRAPPARRPPVRDRPGVARIGPKEGRWPGGPGAGAPAGSAPASQGPGFGAGKAAAARRRAAPAPSGPRRSPRPSPPPCPPPCRPPLPPPGR
ncbi:hypothetical protein SHIRM173S_05157 [Streptomyces hirsutus]